MTGSIKPLESEYDGIRYRSRMEARWAVFMDHLGIPFFYEHEAYDLDGVYYLPDFYLPEQDAFIEIKNPENVNSEWDKVSMLARATGKRAFLFQAPPMLPEGTHHDLEGAIYFCPEKDIPVGGCDYHYLWCRCPRCGKYDIQFDGRADRIRCNCQKSAHGDKGYNSETSSLKHAYQIAKSWRFEPGARNP